MIRRRSFLKGCGGLVAAPLLGHLALPAAVLADDAAAAASLPGSPLPTTARALPVDETMDTALRIDGWEPAHETDVAWMHINASWRATWR